jgi:hypothetical protein
MALRCYGSEEMEDKLKGIANYFIVLKEKNAFQEYFSNRALAFRIVSATMVSLFRTGLEIFVDFLFCLTKYINENTSFYSETICKIAINTLTDHYSIKCCIIGNFLLKWLK